ncbi:PAS domain-containing sensor histidine kinase [Burkholderia glumae]
MQKRHGFLRSRLVRYLEERAGVLARRWLRNARNDPSLARICGLPPAALLQGIAPILNTVCSVLDGERDDALPATAGDLARSHARDRWKLGYRFDDLYRELYLFQRCLQQMAREFFASVASPKDAQGDLHGLIEEFFSAVTHAAIREFVEEQSIQIASANRLRVEAAKALAKTDERLRMAALATGLGIFEWHVPTKAGVWENQLMYEITGQAESLGPLSCHAFVRKLVHPDDADRMVSAYVQAMRDRGEYHTSFRIRRIDDGAVRYVEMHGRFREDDRGAIESFVGTLSDVTRRTLAEESLRDADRRKDAFLAMLAHELRNPLAPIRTAAAVLRRREIAGEGSDMHVIIERQSAHLARLIDDLLDVSRIGTGKIRLRREILDLRDAIRAAVEINAPRASAHGQMVELALPPQALIVDGDVTRLTQVFSNLLDNALKYSPDGRKVTITARATEEFVQVSVADQGFGIPTDLLASLFEPYVQLAPDHERARSGLGIGLSVVRDLVNMHGGTVVALRGQFKNPAQLV